MNIKQYRTIVLSVAAILFIGVFAVAADDAKEDTAKAAPDFKLTDTAGKEVQLSKLKGKIVVLEWTNPDCPFVKPHYKEGVETTKKLAKKYAKQNVVWLTINSSHFTTAADNKKWAQDLDLKQAVLTDQDGKVGKAYGAKTTPHIFIVDKDGKIAYQGAIDNAPRGKKPADGKVVNYADQALSELVAGKPVSVPKTKPYGCSVKYAKPQN